ncbi:hypothetical protein ANCCAN_18803 [Ancylostoma caninum]|uniref:T cell CD4 receptor C-terminal region domain-containing protein n=1 Tax=Ancylostoma caninum TaxID=29170 RepID=A0A368FT26_ANCCA|nr:hypothetical protein ANCCAN_18803 [Ancylostoma caninum]
MLCFLNKDPQSIFIDSRLNTKDRPSIATAGQRVGFKVSTHPVEGLFDENPHSSSALSSSDHKDDGVHFHTCTEFTCQGGQICVEQDQGVCAMRPQLCIHSSLVCNGVQNCVEGDDSDEQHCYSREIIAGSVGGFLGLITVVCICVCCDQWRKRRRVRKMMRERRGVANGKMQRAYRHDVHLNHDIGFDRSDRIDHMPRFPRDSNDSLPPPVRFNRGLPPRPPR